MTEREESERSHPDTQRSVTHREGVTERKDDTREGDDRERG